MLLFHETSHKSDQCPQRARSHTIRNRCFTRPLTTAPPPSDELKLFQWRFIARFYLSRSIILSYVAHSASKSFQLGDSSCDAVPGPICRAFMHVMHKQFYMFCGNNYIYSRGHWAGICLTKTPQDASFLYHLLTNGRTSTYADCVLFGLIYFFPPSGRLSFTAEKASVQTTLIYFYFRFVFLPSCYAANGVNLEKRRSEKKSFFGTNKSKSHSKGSRLYLVVFRS